MQSDNYLKKEEFVNFIYERYEKKLPKEAITQWVDVVIDSLKAVMMETPGVRIFKFGTFDIRRRKGSKVRHFETGEFIDVPPKNIPRFTPGKYFKNECNEQLNKKK